MSEPLTLSIETTRPPVHRFRAGARGRGTGHPGPGVVSGVRGDGRVGPRLSTRQTWQSSCRPAIFPLDRKPVSTNTVRTNGNPGGGEGVAQRGLGDEIKKRDPFESPEQEVALNLARTSDRHFAGFTRLFKSLGITAAQYNVLRILRGAGEALPCQEIGGRMITQLPDITRLVDRLEEAGLVERSRTPEDRRLVLTKITEPGLRLLAGLDGPVSALHTAQLGHLTRDEVAELNRLLVKARGPEGAGPPPRPADPGPGSTGVGQSD